MTVVLVLVGLMAAFIFGSLLLVMFAVGQIKPASPGKTAAPTSQNSFRFRWKYVALPLAALLISVLAAGLFYGKLPAEGAHYSPIGQEGAATSRAGLIAWLLMPQAALALLSAGLVWTVTHIRSLAEYAGETGVSLDGIVMVMGNLIGLPQLILLFAMVNTFGYNAYGKSIVPVWAIVIILVVLGVAVTGIFFVRAIRRLWVKR
jgi:hypothetical protein